MEILILGIRGMVGNTLFEYFLKNSAFETYGTIRNNQPISGTNCLFESSFIYRNIDANSLDKIENLITILKPNIVINCIGIIKQLSIAKDPIASIAINSLFPHQLAQLCQKYNAKLIQISTDCVFSGNKGNYTEQDNPDPVDLYGRTKLLGEVTSPNCLTIRTSIIGRELNSQNSLVEWFISQKGKTVKGFDRAIYTGFTTQTLAQIVEKIILEQPNLEGMWHISSDPTTKYQLLNMMNQAFNLGITIEKDESFICDRSLNSQKFRDFTGYTPPTWEEMIAQLAASQ
ncbi:SDR family oxidoreductase [Pseudanabaena sp. 'Roaring Creek']|uniref:dTDP-4-dehydrorhamnose reductase family protein n=1 Tax=Pseudanabaena sp. 'Roaring Creek' TaxID=1681830 RepID=UPI0006D7AB55|nr:SDR family oxidoreductase [Pseudanabaena sp. 'Roaring Creek']